MAKAPLPGEACRSGQYFSELSAGTCSKTGRRYGLYPLSLRLGAYTLSSHSGREQRFYIPERVLDYFNEEFDYREVTNSSELTDIAVAIFVGMLDTPAVSIGGGGGDSQSDLPWRDKDDDDLQWARRCARAATLLLGKKPRTGLRR